MSKPKYEIDMFSDLRQGSEETLRRFHSDTGLRDTPELAIAARRKWYEEKLRHAQAKLDAFNAITDFRSFEIGDKNEVRELAAFKITT